VLIIDAHLDHGWNALQWNRNLLDPVYTIRRREAGRPGVAMGNGTVGFPEMREGRIALCFATLLARSTGSPEPHIDYDTAFQANAIAKAQLAYYRVLENQGIVRVITETRGLEAHLSEWETFDADPAAKPENAPPLGFIVSMEGADPILEPEDLEEWWDAGVRLLGLSHYGSCRYAGGTKTETGLTDLGKPLLAEMERLGTILDLTHCSDPAFWEALEIYGGPVHASHCNCRALVPNQRQLSDDMIRAIIERDGVIGAVFDAWMLEPGWVIGKSRNDRLTTSAVIDQIDYVCQLAGDSRHAGIGSDLDGGFGTEQAPNDFDTIADLQMLGGMLNDRGYRQKDVEAIFHGNWLRLIRRCWLPSLSA
jgi:membrane dipeptidase